MSCRIDLNSIDSLKKFENLLSLQYEMQENHPISKKCEVRETWWGDHSVKIVYSNYFSPGHEVALEEVPINVDFLLERFQDLSKQAADTISRMEPSTEKYCLRKEQEGHLSRILERFKVLQSESERISANSDCLDCLCRYRCLDAIFAAIGRLFRCLLGIKEATSIADLVSTGEASLNAWRAARGDATVASLEVAATLPPQCIVNETTVSCHDLLDHFLPEPDIERGLYDGQFFRQLQAFWVEYEKVTLAPASKATFEALLKMRCAKYLQATSGVGWHKDREKLAIRLPRLFGTYAFSSENLQQFLQSKSKWPNILVDLIKDEILKNLNPSLQNVGLVFFGQEDGAYIFGEYFAALTAMFFSHPTPKDSIVASVPNLMHVTTSMHYADIYKTDPENLSVSAEAREALKQIVTIQPRLRVNVWVGKNVETVMGKYGEHLVLSEEARKLFKEEQLQEGMVSIETYLNTLMPGKKALLEELAAFDQVHSSVRKMNSSLAKRMEERLFEHCKKYLLLEVTSGSSDITIKVSLSSLYGSEIAKVAEYQNGFDSNGRLAKRLVMDQIYQTIAAHKDKRSITMVFQPNDFASGHRQEILNAISNGSSSVTLVRSA